jgi:PKD repeat protein
VVVSQSSVCLGQVVNFSFNNPGLSSFFWKFGDGSFSNVNPASHAYTANGSFTATLIGTSTAFGCTDSSKKVITILSSPVAAITATPTIGCQPLTVAFTNSTPFSSFNQWTYGDGNSSAAYAPTHTYTIAGTFNVKFISTNASGCTDTAYIPIYVYATPLASFQLSDTFACSPPGVVNVFNTSSNANGFTWSDGNGGINLNTNATFTYNAASTYTITLTATNQFNCTATASHNYILYPKPVADFLGVPLIGCEPLPVAFTDASQNSVYQHWNFGDANFAINNPTPNHTYAKAGVYTVTLDIEGINHVCTDSITKVAYITVLPKPVAVFSFDNKNTPEPAVEVDFNSQASINATSYIWNFGDGSALAPTTDFTATHAYSTYGNYTVYLIAQHANGCSDTTNQLIETSYITGLFVPNAMSPNAGANEEVKVFKPKGLGLASYHVQVFSTWGEKLWESYEIDEHGAPKEAWDGTFKGELMPQDVYVWKIDGVFSNANVWKGNTYDGKKFSQTGTISLLR